MKLRPATAAHARARGAAGLAWRTLVQVVAGRDPAPAWRAPGQRRAAFWVLAAATVVAIAAGVGALVSVRDQMGVPRPHAGQLSPTRASVAFQGPAILHLPQPWAVTVSILVAMAGVAPLPLAIRRPLLAWRIGWLALLAVPWMGIRWLPGGPVFANWPWDPVQLAVLAVVFTAAGMRHQRAMLWWIWALTLLPWWVQARHPWPGLTSLTVGTMVFTVAAVAADALGGRRRAQLALADAARRAEAEAARAEAEAARSAVLEERARIARELHDVVAHHMSLITVRAESAPYRLTRLPDDARAEFGELSDTAREAMNDMERLLGLLRTGETPASAPQPQLDDLPGLIDSAQRAGLPVRLSQQGSADRLPDAVGVCAYRIVQESLSNAGRHAPGAAVSVAVVVKPPVVRLKVSNGPPAATTGAVNGHRDGHGLAGMRERITLLGGTFSAGPAPDGGFEVTAELPTGEPA